MMYRKIKDKLYVFLCVLLILHYSHASDESSCDLTDIDESIQDIGKDIDNKKFNEGDIAEIDGKIGGVIDRFTNLPEDCQQSGEIILESVKDIKILRQYAKVPSGEKSTDDKSFFEEMLTIAEGITPLDKQAELYRALARISPLDDFEINQKFYTSVKDKIASADSTVSNILLETMKTIAAKSILTVESLVPSVHPELLLDLYAYDKVAGKETAEKLARDLCSKNIIQCFATIFQIPDLSLRLYGFLTGLSMDTAEAQGMQFLFLILPPLISAVESTELEQLDGDLKERVNKAYEDLPLEIRVLMASGEICASDNVTRSQDIYIKHDENDVLRDWKFVETPDGEFLKESAAPRDEGFSLRFYLPSKLNVPDLFTEKSTTGNWEMAPDGTDCSYKEETHNTYICYQAKTFMRRLAQKKVFEDVVTLKESGSKRKEICGV